MSDKFNLNIINYLKTQDSISNHTLIMEKIIPPLPVRLTIFANDGTRKNVTL